MSALSSGSERSLKGVGVEGITPVCQARTWLQGKVQTEERRVLRRSQTAGGLCSNPGVVMGLQLGYGSESRRKRGLPVCARLQETGGEPETGAAALGRDCWFWSKHGNLPALPL